MTARDYKLITKCLGLAMRYATGSDKQRAINNCIEHFIIELRADNPRFDEEMFRRAIDATAQEES